MKHLKNDVIIYLIILSTIFVLYAIRSSNALGITDIMYLITYHAIAIGLLFLHKKIIIYKYTWIIEIVIGLSMLLLSDTVDQRIFYPIYAISLIIGVIFYSLTRKKTGSSLFRFEFGSLMTLITVAVLVTSIMNYTEVHVLLNLFDTSIWIDSMEYLIILIILNTSLSILKPIGK